MKKILTLLLAVGAISIAQAQYSRPYPDDRSENRNVILGDRNDRSYGNESRYNYSFTERERDKAIDRINHDFDKRIRQVERDRRMRPNEKDYAIRQIEDQRRDEVRRIWDRYRSNNNSAYDNDRYRQNDRRW